MRIFVVGYYGFGLVSDDAVLQSIVDDLRDELGSEVRISATSAGRAAFAVKDVEEVPIDSLTAVLAEIRLADLVIIGGGGVYNEDNPYNARTFLTPRQAFNDLCASVPVLCLGVRKPCVVYSVGVFSLKTPRLRERIQLAFRSASAASVRDRTSLANLDAEPHSLAGVAVNADPVFRLKAVDLGEDQAGFTAPDGPVVGVSLRHWRVEDDASPQPSAWEAELAAALDQFIEAHDAQCVFLPFQSIASAGPFSDDVPVIERVRERMKQRARAMVSPVISSPHAMAWRIRSTDVMICMRYHSMIMAIAQERPFVALGYSEKLRNTLEDVGFDHAVVDLEGLTAKRVFTVLNEQYHSREIGKALRAEVASRSAGKSAANVAMTAAVVAQNKVGSIDGEALAELLFESVERISRFEEQASRDDASLDTRIFLAGLIADEDAADGDAQLAIGKLLVERCASDEARPEDAKGAAERLTAALSAGADRYWTHFYRSAARYHLGQYEGALEDVKAAAVIRPDRDDWKSIEQASTQAIARRDHPADMPESSGDRTPDAG